MIKHKIDNNLYNFQLIYNDNNIMKKEMDEN